MDYRPQVIRKKLIIKTPQIKVVTTPSRQRPNIVIVNQNKTQIAKQPATQAFRAIQTIQAQIKQKPPISVISTKSLLKRKSTVKKEVKYITSEPNPESAQKLNQLRSKGIGKFLVIVGNGPSILETELSKLKNHSKIDIMSINKPDPRLWPTTYWTFFDRSQLTRNEELWNSYNGIIFNGAAIKKTKPSTIQIKNLNGEGFSRDMVSGVYIGRSSVYAAMQIGLWIKYDHIYLFGVDMNAEGLNGKLHFYGVNPDVDQQTRKDRFKNEAKHYSYAAKQLTDSERNLFTFCSSCNPWPFVDQFNKLDHKIAVDVILNQANVLK